MKLKRASLTAVREAASAATVENISQDNDSQAVGIIAEILSTETEVTKKRKRMKPSRIPDSDSIADINSRKLVGNSVKDDDASITKYSGSNSISASADKGLSLDVVAVGDLCNERTIYIEGLPYDSTEEDVCAFFKSCGPIDSVRLPKWHDSGRLRGYGHVQFSSVTSIKQALNLDGIILLSKVLWIIKYSYKNHFQSYFIIAKSFVITLYFLIIEQAAT